MRNQVHIFIQVDRYLPYTCFTSRASVVCLSRFPRIVEHFAAFLVKKVQSIFTSKPHVPGLD